MKKEDFNLINIPASGAYRLVEDSVLEEVLSLKKWMFGLKTPTNGVEAVAFSVKFFRAVNDLSKTQLATKSGIHRNQIKAIESGLMKKSPHEATLNDLAKVLGEDFKNAMIQLGCLKERTIDQ